MYIYIYMKPPTRRACRNSQIHYIGGAWWFHARAMPVKFRRCSASVSVRTAKYGSAEWPFQEPKLELPTIYKAYIRPM